MSSLHFDLKTTKIRKCMYWKSNFSTKKDENLPPNCAWRETRRRQRLSWRGRTTSGRRTSALSVLTKIKKKMFRKGSIFQVISFFCKYSTGKWRTNFHKIIQTVVPRKCIVYHPCSRWWPWTDSPIRLRPASFDSTNRPYLEPKLKMGYSEEKIT